MRYIDSFIEIKQLSEALWDKENPERIYGYQFQPKTKWKNGLSDSDISAFEKAVGFDFPEILRDYYSVMNGVDKESVNTFRDSGCAYTYSKMLYSYPEDMRLLENLTQLIYDENYIERDTMNKKNISRIFPVYAHNFILVDHPGHPVLSMYGQEIFYSSNNLVDMLYRELLGRDEWKNFQGMGYGWIESTGSS
jgi:hypothetical protein